MRTDRLFTLRWLPNGSDAVRLAVAAPRSVGTSVRRNRARRRVREAIRRELAAVISARGTDLFVVARPAALSAPISEIRAAAARQLSAVLS